MKKAIQTIKALRLKGAPISYNVINAIAKGIVVANDRTMLVEHGGHLNFTDNWVRNVLNEVQRSKKRTAKRMATTSKISISPGLLKEEQLKRPCSKLQSNAFLLHYCGKQYSRI